MARAMSPKSQECFREKIDVPMYANTIVSLTYAIVSKTYDEETCDASPRL